MEKKQNCVDRTQKNMGYAVRGTGHPRLFYNGVLYIKRKSPVSDFLLEMFMRFYESSRKGGAFYSSSIKP